MPIAGVTNQFNHFGVAFGRRFHSAQLIKSRSSFDNASLFFSAFFFIFSTKTFVFLVLEKSGMSFFNRSYFTFNAVANFRNANIDDLVQGFLFRRRKFSGQFTFRISNANFGAFLSGFNGVEKFLGKSGKAESGS